MSMKGFPSLSLGRKAIDPPKGLKPLNAKTLLTKHLAKQLAEVKRTQSKLKIPSMKKGK